MVKKIKIKKEHKYRTQLKCHPACNEMGGGDPSYVTNLWEIHPAWKLPIIIGNIKYMPLPKPFNNYIFVLV